MTDQPEPLSDAALARLEEAYERGPISSEKSRPDGGYPEWVLWHAFPALVSRLRLAEAALDELEEHIRSMIEECEQTLTWRNTRGMKTAGDSSDFASVSQSGVIRLKHSLRNALDCAARAAEEDTRG